MFDPAAMGTLKLGLDAAASESHADRPRRAATTRQRQPGTIRLALASGLRRAAAALEKPATSEVAC